MKPSETPSRRRSISRTGAPHSRRKATGPAPIDRTRVRGIRILVACEHCEESGWVKGGRYIAQGEVVRCPFCNGEKTTPITVTIEELARLLAPMPEGPTP